ncbi:site-specific DNA-methyltransferase [Avibacterium avium]|uniref:site-specific DNA-methyltransferase n=1 Tax=Avibacterium avium TaxID=751 RepID=UPI003BF7AFF2
MGRSGSDRIGSDRIGSDCPSFNFLIQGDNLHSLKILEKTHRNKIDVIYIDPPYNTGNKDFIYNDRYVDNNDGYRHSKWLSFMSKRLEIAKNLLSKQGVIFISIDDNEQAQLKLLCDEIFGENNFIAELPTIMNLKGNQDEFGFAGTHEYTLCYARNKIFCKLNEFIIPDEDIENWLEDQKGYYKKGATLKRTGIDAPRNNRPKSYYPILVKNGKVFSIDEIEYNKIYDKDKKTFNDDYVEDLIEKYSQKGFYVVLPKISGEKTSWRWQYSKIKNESDEIIVTTINNEISLYKKQRPQLGEIPTKKPKTIFYKPEYSSGNGTKQIKEIFGKKLFNNPKPIELIKDLLILSTDKNSIILDFFAGSGTTGHAVAQLNKEDGGNRTYILCTNNENNICEQVTYQRLKNIQKEFSHNLKYLETEFIPRFPEDEIGIQTKLMLHIKELIELEYGCEIDGIRNILIQLEDELEDYLTEDLKIKARIFLSPYIFLDQTQNALIHRKQAIVIEIPEYYFRNELIEAGEL